MSEGNVKMIDMAISKLNELKDIDNAEWALAFNDSTRLGVMKCLNKSWQSIIGLVEIMKDGMRSSAKEEMAMESSLRDEASGSSDNDSGPSGDTDKDFKDFLKKMFC